VLYFYPKDGTPGCTWCHTDFSDHEDQFVSKMRGARRVGDDC